MGVGLVGVVPVVQLVEAASAVAAFPNVEASGIDDIGVFRIDGYG